MKTRFSLRTLLVATGMFCIVLAVPLTIIRERNRAEAFHRRTMYAASLLHGSGIGLKGYAENETDRDGHKGTELIGVGGEVTEEIAKRFVDSGFTFVVLYGSRITEDARQEMDTEFAYYEQPYYAGQDALIVFTRRE